MSHWLVFDRFSLPDTSSIHKMLLLYKELHNSLVASYCVGQQIWVLLLSKAYSEIKVFGPNGAILVQLHQ